MDAFIFAGNNERARGRDRRDDADLVLSLENKTGREVEEAGGEGGGGRTKGKLLRVSRTHRATPPSSAADNVPRR